MNYFPIIPLRQFIPQISVDLVRYHAFLIISGALKAVVVVNSDLDMFAYLQLQRKFQLNPLCPIADPRELYGVFEEQNS